MPTPRTDPPRRRTAMLAALLIFSLMSTVSAQKPPGAAPGAVHTQDTAASAAEADGDEVEQPGKQRKLRRPLPFKYGERLVYEVHFSSFPISADVGVLPCTVSDLPGSTQHI